MGDYAAHTAHLEPMEDLAYRRMLDLYYLRESPLPSDPVEVARLVRLRQNIDEVKAVLGEFFTQTADGWRHFRCDQEIERMQDKQAKARASAAASVNARRTKASDSSGGNSTDVERPLNERSANVERTLNVRSTNVELPTPTPIPIPKEGERGGASAPPPPRIRPTKRCPRTFEVTEVMRQWASTEAPGIDVDLETAKLMDHEFGSARTDWVATWRNWMRKAAELPSRGRARPGPRDDPFAGAT